MQKQALREIIEASDPSSSPAATAPTNTEMLEFLMKRKKENRHF
jgi:hypothetical protein